MKKIRICVEQNADFLQKLYRLIRMKAVQKQNQVGKFRQIIGIGTGKSHAFSPLRRHIQGIIPVCIPQAADVMFSDFIKGGELLDDKVFQNTAHIDGLEGRFLPASVFFIPEGVELGAPHDLSVFEIGNLSV